jgi:hypothetical protein
MNAKSCSSFTYNIGKIATVDARHSMGWWGYRDAYRIIKKIHRFVSFLLTRRCLVSTALENNVTLTTPAQLIMSTGRAALLMASQRRSRQTGKNLL